MPNRSLHRLRIRLLSQGLPTSEDLERRCVQTSMCLPVAPTTRHLAGRPPAIPSKSFPWVDMYHHSPMYTTLRVPTCTQNYSLAIFSSHQDMNRLRRICDEDEAERKVLIEATRTADADGSPLMFLTGLRKSMTSFSLCFRHISASFPRPQRV